MTRKLGIFKQTLRCVLTVGLFLAMGEFGLAAQVISPLTGQSSTASYPEFRPPPLKHFSAMVQRPLFSRNRLPSTQSNLNSGPVLARRNTGLTKTTKTDFYLSGVIYNGTEYSVLIKQTAQGEIQRVGKGEMIGGWRVEDIKPEEVWLRSGNSISVVSLRDNKLTDPEKRKFVRRSIARQKILQRKKRMIEARKKLTQRKSLQQKFEKRREN